METNPAVSVELSAPAKHLKVYNNSRDCESSFPIPIYSCASADQSCGLGGPHWRQVVRSHGPAAPSSTTTAAVDGLWTEGNRSKCRVRMRGLPFTATEADVVHFFRPLQPVTVCIRSDRVRLCLAALPRSDPHVDPSGTALMAVDCYPTSSALHHSRSRGMRPTFACGVQLVS